MTADAEEFSDKHPIGLVKAMGMSGISKSHVSRLCEKIDVRVKAFLERPIEGDWPYIWIDATPAFAGSGCTNFIDQHNADPKPFRWTKSADHILASIQRFSVTNMPDQTSGSPHQNRERPLPGTINCSVTGLVDLP